MSTSETQRLAALREFGVLDTVPEDGFDRLTALAAELFGAPIALVSLIDEGRQWFKSRVGLGATETPRAWAFCDHAIAQEGYSAFVVEDATKDARFFDNPLVTGDPSVRFYAGAVLTTASGHNLGTLCVIDTSPRTTPSPSDIEKLKLLARMVVDELDLRQARKAVKEQSLLLKLAETMAGVGHWRLEAAGGRIVWSDEVYRIHGVDPANFDPNLDQGVAFYHPDDQSAVATFIERALSHGEDFSFQLRLLRSDGELRNVVAKGSCEIDSTGAASAIFGVFQDVTDQVRALNVVAQSESRYRLLTENANDVVTQMDGEGRLTYVSPASTKMMGYTSGELVGRSALALIHADDRAAVTVAYQRAARGEGDLRFECRVVRKDGGVAWVESRPTVVNDLATGERIGITDVIRDISDRKVLEDDLRSARAEAEAAAAVKGEFLANMSHELRTPLTSIMGFSKLIAEQPDLGEQTRRYVQRVEDGSKALLTTVNDILDFSKLEAGQVQIDLRPVDPSKVVEGALGLLAPQADAKGLYRRLDCEGLPHQILADDTRIRQVLLNFIGNALKFTTEGGVTVKARYDDATSRLRCEVIDTGPGVAVDRLDRLFKRFSQVDASTTRSHGGTGLGLAICKGLAEAMGGEVGVESKLGAGSTFWIEIACERVVDARPAHSETRSHVGGSASSDGFEGLRILVADDNAFNRELVRILLEPSRVVFSEAASGEAAIDLAQSTPFDLILMDVRMPDIDGPAAALAIREGGGPNSDVPIIAFTADASDRALPAEWTAIFDDQLPKPVVPAALLGILDAWAPGRTGAAVAGARTHG